MKITFFLFVSQVLATQVNLNIINVVMQYLAATLVYK